MQRLLVAGDNDEAARIHECLRNHYTRRGCSVIYCPAPGELMRQLKKSPPDAIFMHFQCSELTVYEIYQQIRSIKEGRLLPILVLETEMLGGTSSAVETLILLKMPLTVSHLIRQCSNVLKQDVATTDPSVLCEPTFMRFEQEEEDPEQEAEEQRKQRLREHSIQLREDVTPKEQFYLIPEHVRRRWFYNSEFVQGIFDRIEDSDWYQRRCRKRYSHLAPPPPPPEVEQDETAQDAAVETPASEAPKPEPRRDMSPEAKRQRKARSGRIAIAVLLVVVAVAGVFFAASRILLTNTLCPQCGTQEEQVVWNIHSATCGGCGGHVGFACKCEECGHEFAFVPGLDTKTRFGASMAPPCPECASPKTIRLGR